MMTIMAVDAKRAGAEGKSTNWERDVKEIKKTVDLPVIGLIKKEY